MGLLKRMGEHRRRATHKALAESLANPEPPAQRGFLRSDLIPINLSHVTFGYAESTGSVLRDVNLSCPQGKMIAIVGSPGSGKASFMRLLSQTIFPSEGHIEVPQHLRVLFVSQLPVLFDRSPWYNLVFGRPDLEDARHVKRVLTELQMPQTLGLLRNEFSARSDGAPKRRTVRDLRRNSMATYDPK